MNPRVLRCFVVDFPQERPMRFISKLLLLFVVSIPALSGAGEPRADRKFDAKGVKLNYIIEGEGEPVVLIHGLSASARINWQMPGIISMLSKKYQVIALDLPGHGESDKPTNEEAYGSEMVEDVLRLLDHLKIQKAHIAGYSMGGMIAVKFMTMHQDRVLSCVVSGMGWLREGSALQKMWGRMQ